MIKLIIFDFSDVCFSLEEPPFLQKFAREHHLSYPEFEAAYMELLKKAEVGEDTGINLWEKILRKYNLKGDPQQIIKEMIISPRNYIRSIKQPILQTIMKTTGNILNRDSISNHTLTLVLFHFK